MKRKMLPPLSRRKVLSWQQALLPPVFFIAACLLAACRETTIDSQPQPRQSQPSESLIEAQRIATQREIESLEAFVARSGWPMEETARGVWYYVYRPSAQSGQPMVARGDMIQIEYYLQLLNGKIIDSSEKSGPKTIKVGHSDIESGLEEALLLMRRGDCAKILIPSFLGHGFSGDGIRVPPGASLLYDIKIL